MVKKQRCIFISDEDFSILIERNPGLGLTEENSPYMDLPIKISTPTKEAFEDLTHKIVAYRGKLTLNDIINENDVPLNKTGLL